MSDEVVKSEDKVGVLYKGTLNDGSVFDENTEDKPLEFTAGKGMVIKGFDDAIMGMKVGESKTFTVLAAEAYGEIKEEAKAEVPKTQLPEEIRKNVTKDQMLGVQTPQGMMQVKVLEVGEENVTIDLNHPLAGKDLTFEIKVLSIN